MADSENSRTMPAIMRRIEDRESGGAENMPSLIDRRNLLPLASRLLNARVAEVATQPRAGGPTPVSEMWPRWYAHYQQRVRATRLRQKVEAEMLEGAGGFPVVELTLAGNDTPIVIKSLPDINRLANQLDAGQLSHARAELRRRRRHWKEADRLLGYSAVVALEQGLAEQAGISERVMWITRPSSLIEVTAKLHCLIVMHDPDLKHEGSPWPELRTMLKDLVRLGECA